VDDPEPVRLKMNTTKYRTDSKSRARGTGRKMGRREWLTGVIERRGNRKEEGWSERRGEKGLVGGGTGVRLGKHSSGKWTPARQDLANVNLIPGQRGLLNCGLGKKPEGGSIQAKSLGEPVKNQLVMRQDTIR